MKELNDSDGEKIIKNVLFYAGYSMNLNDESIRTDNSEILRGGKGHDLIDATTDTTPIYTPQSNNNYYKRKIFTSNLEIDTINNCFYMFERKVA